MGKTNSMSYLRSLSQPLACAIGVHESPPPRDPHGPIVADCPCCHKTVYYYGLSVYGIGSYHVLLVPTFPRLKGALPPGIGGPIGTL
ncbi:MAG TPA: hypothetical protein VGS41_11930 [Chthonomonadales bacterium]|nr:hypothetical protein [Chthonomonadales bacterium]